MLSRTIAFITVAALFFFSRASAQNPEVCGAANQQQTQTGGYLVTSFGTVKALFIFIDFSDDTNDLNNSTWPVGTGPNYLNQIVDSTVTQNSGIYANASTFFNNQSFGQFKMIGKAYYVQAPHTLSWYHSNHLGYEVHYSAQDAIQTLDQSVDFADFDRWTDGSYSHSAGSDGILDMVFVCYRMWYLKGVQGSSFFAEGWWSAYLPSDVYVDGGARRIVSSHAVDVLNMIQYPRFEHLVHEFGHVWGLNHQYAPGMWSLMGQKQPSASSFMNSLERVQLGWTTFSTPADGQTYNIPDFGTTGIAYRIAVPNTNPQEYFIIENHQDLTLYDLPDNTGAKGIYILQNAPIVEPGGPPATVRVIPADGRWNWSVPYWIQNPWNLNQPDDLIPVFQRGTANTISGSSDHDVIYAYHPNSINSGYNMMYAWLDEATGAEIHGTRFKGDGHDRWAASEVSLFSPGTNPSSCSTNGTQTTIGTEVGSPSGNTIPVKFYLSNPPYFSAPKNLVFVNANANGQRPNLTWTANVEPDVAGYNVYREYYDGYLDIDVTEQIAALYAWTSYTDNTAWTSNVYSSRILFYWVTAADQSGHESPNSNEVASNGRVPGYNGKGGGEQDQGILQRTPTTFALHQNNPNPFNPTTLITYQLPFNSSVKLEVYDIRGRKVIDLVNGAVEAGYHTISFDASHLSSGMYVYRFEAISSGDGGERFTDSKKMVLVR